MKIENKNNFMNYRDSINLKNYLDDLSLKFLIHSCVSSHTDNSNSLYYNLSNTKKNQNFSKRLIRNTPKYEHIKK